MHPDLIMHQRQLHTTSVDIKEAAGFKCMVLSGAHGPSLMVCVEHEPEE